MSRRRGMDDRRVLRVLDPTKVRPDSRRSALRQPGARRVVVPCGRRRLLPRHGSDQGRRGRAVAGGDPGAATPGWCGPPATIGSGTCWASPASGAVDFLKVVSSHPSQKYSRACDPAQLADKSCQNRWEYFGLVNEPCFEKATGPDPTRWDLWLDKRKAGCGADPFENADEVPGRHGRLARQDAERQDVRHRLLLRLRHRHRRLPPVSEPGVRREARPQRWDAEKYYTDPALRQGQEPRQAVPGRHVVRALPRRARIRSSRRPIRTIPTWANLSSNVGAQYFWVDRIFFQEADDTNFAFQLFHASRPGTLDTSFVSTDSINNPRTMNAVYLLGPRLLASQALGQGDAEGRRPATITSSTTTSRTVR